MHTFIVHTLVDITDNGLLKKEFPFKTKSGEMVHDKQSLFTARNQNSNFTTMLQILQIRGNIEWEHPPMKVNDLVINTKFGQAYDGKHNIWTFTFLTEQQNVYGNDASGNIGNLIGDFHLIPILSFCKETATFPSNTFITEDDHTINTYFSYQGITNK